MTGSQREQDRREIPTTAQGIDAGRCIRHPILEIPAGEMNDEGTVRERAPPREEGVAPRCIELLGRPER